MLSLIPLATLLGLGARAALIERQSISSAPASSSFAPSSSGTAFTTVTTSVFPGGVSEGSTRFESTLPLPCVDGCWYFSAPYAYCFLLSAYPNGTATGPESCNGICNQTYYDGLSSCLNCIIANGGERPFGYSTNTAVTTQSVAPGSPASRVEQNPNGLIDLNQANGWLRNVTSRCAAQGTTLTGASSITALPTTTGPFAANWTRGETISRTAWTGLTQYTPPVYTVTQQVGAPWSSTVRISGSGAASASATPTSASAASSAAASQSSRAAGVESAQKPVGWLMGGALLAWAVL